MPEIATAWVTLAISADGMRRDIRRELERVDGRREFSRLGRQLEQSVGRSTKTAATQVQSTLGERLGARVGTAMGNAISVSVIRPLSPAIRGIARLMGKAGDDSGREFNRQFESRTRSVGSGRGGIFGGGRSSGAAATIGGIARVAGPAATAILGVGSAYQVLSSGFSRLRSIDDAKFKLRSLGNDAKTVDRIMVSALEAVKGTAFGMDEAATTAATAVAAGVAPGQDLTKYLTTIGDAAAIGNTSLDDMGRIFNKVQTSGKAMTDDLQMLGDRGLPIFTWLQKEYGVTGEALSKMVSDGKVDSATFQRVVAQNIGGAAKGMGASFSGSMKNMSAAISRLGAAALEPFFGLGGDALGKITEAIDKLTVFIKDHQPEIVEFTATVAGGFTEMAAAATGAFGGMLRGFARVIEAMRPMVSQIGGFLSTVGGFKLFGQEFSPQMKDAGDALQRFDQNMGNAVETLNTAAENVDTFKDRIYGTADSIRDWGDQTSAGIKLTKELGDKIEILPDSKTIVLKDNAPETIQKVKDLGYEVRRLPNGQLTIEVKYEQIGSAIDTSNLPRPQNLPPGIGVSAAPPPAATSAYDPTRSIFGRFADGAIVPFGAIVPMADGGYRWMTKPQSADIYAGRGAGTIFAERETGGEAYIPLAPSKRPRSLAILMEVARLFGLNSNAEGSITVDELKSFASGISGQRYVWGGGNGDTWSTDCSGGQAFMANYITGASGRFSTASQSQGLLARGFQQGDPPAGIAAYWVGWKNGGPGGGHTAGTIIDPEGGDVNVEMGGRGGNGQYGGSAAGAAEFPNRAWIALAGYGDDPTKTGGGSTAAVKSAQASVTSAKASTQSAQNAVDKAEANVSKLQAEGASADKIADAEKKRDVAQQKLTAAEERQSAAETRLAEVKDKEALKAEKETSSVDSGSGNDMGGESLGQSIISGLLQGIGLDGSVFSNPLDWPNVKSGLALLNWGGGLLRNLGVENAEGGIGQDVAGGALGGIGLPNITDLIKPPPPGSTTPVRWPDEMHSGSGSAPGPARAGDTYNISGVNPADIVPKIEARQNAAWRRNTGAHR